MRMTIANPGLTINSSCTEAAMRFCLVGKYEEKLHDGSIRKKVWEASGEIHHPALALGRAIAFPCADGRVRAREFYINRSPAAVAFAIDGSISESVLVAELFDDLSKRIAQRLATGR